MQTSEITELGKLNKSKKTASLCLCPTYHELTTFTLLYLVDLTRSPFICIHFLVVIAHALVGYLADWFLLYLCMIDI